MSVLVHHVRMQVFALSPAAMIAWLRAAMCVLAVMGMLGAHVRQILTSVLMHHVRMQVYVQSRKLWVVVLLQMPMHVLVPPDMMGTTVRTTLTTVQRNRAEKIEVHAATLA